MSKNVEINPKNLILFWKKEKNYILFFSILGMSLFLLYSIYSKQNFQTKITIKDPPNIVFEPYNSLFYGLQNNTFRSNYNNNNLQQIGKSYLQAQFVIIFNQNIKSIYNFREFLKKDNNFEKFYKSKDINLEKYFMKSNFSNIKKKEINDNLFEYQFVFPEDFQGDIFFKNYIIYTQNKTMVDFETEVKATISNTNYYEQQILNFIKKLDITSIADLKQNNLSDQLVYQNFNNISLQIEKNKMLADSLTYKKFDHNPFFEEPSKPIPLYKYSKLLFSLFGLSLGFLLSLIIIYFKNLKVIL